MKATTLSSKRQAVTKKTGVPGTYREFIGRFPALGRAHEAVAKSVESVGPLDAKTLALVKIGICTGAGLESALRSHVRRAMHHGATKAEIEQTILLAMNTVGFPRTVAAWSLAPEKFDHRPSRRASMTTIATTAARRAAGSIGQAATTAAKPGSVGASRVGFGVERLAE